MKELLYIPTGQYFRFNGGEYPFGDFHSHCVKIYETDADLLLSVVRGIWQNESYLSAGIPIKDKKNLQLCEFEIIEV